MLQTSDDKKHVLELEAKIKKTNEQMKMIYTENLNSRKEYDRMEHEMESAKKKVN